MPIFSALAKRAASTTTFRSFTTTAAIMGVEKTTTKEGYGPIPQMGQTVAMEYTGYLKDTSKLDNKGAKYVQSPGW
jgi:FK506-binding protein 1